MESNICPCCGSAFSVTKDGFRQNNTNKLFLIYQGYCDFCGAYGPEAKTHDAAIAEFNHPVYLMDGKVLVSVEDAKVLLSFRCDTTDEEDEVFDRLSTAIDAASKE